VTGEDEAAGRVEGGRAALLLTAEAVHHPSHMPF
jgi:hypothetical protein